MLEQSEGLLAVAFILAWAGFGVLALAQERHFEHFYASNKLVAQHKRAQAAIGIIAILITLPICMKAQGAGFGGLLWVLLLTASAMAVAFQLTWTPRVLGVLAWLVKNLFSKPC